MKWLGRYPLSIWLEAILKPFMWLGRHPVLTWSLIPVALFVSIVIFVEPPPPPLTPELQAIQQQRAERAEQIQRAEQKREVEVREQKVRLCRWAATCRRYDAARLECATAGNFNMCLKIKMGSEADYIGACSGFKEGAPTVAPSPETPNLIECFFLTGKL
jgi:hypothetical protein